MLCRMGETVTSLPHGGAAHLGWGPGLRGGCGYVCVLGGAELGTQGRRGPGASTPSQQAALTISWMSRPVLASGCPHDDPRPLSPGLRQVAGDF